LQRHSFKKCWYAKQFSSPHGALIATPDSVRVKRADEFSSPHGALIATTEQNPVFPVHFVFVPSRSANCNMKRAIDFVQFETFSSPHGALIATHRPARFAGRDRVFVPSRSANCNDKPDNQPVTVDVFVPSRSANCNVFTWKTSKYLDDSFRPLTER